MLRLREAGTQQGSAHKPVWGPWRLLCRHEHICFLLEGPSYRIGSPLVYPNPRPGLRLPVPLGSPGIIQVCPLEAGTVANAIGSHCAFCCTPGQAHWPASHISHQITEGRVVQGDRCYSGPRSSFSVQSVFLGALLSLPWGPCSGCMGLLQQWSCTTGLCLKV